MFNATEFGSLITQSPTFGMRNLPRVWEDFTHEPRAVTMRL